MSCVVLETTPLAAREVLKTYLFGWVLFPLLIFGPGLIAIREVRTSLGIPDSWEVPLIVFAILWLVVAAWKLADWHEAKGRPRRR